MKEFNLELAKQGHPVCTRDGHNVRIVCFDRKDNKFPIVALILFDGGEEMFCFTSEGRFQLSPRLPDSYDLMMASSKREGWINIYENRQISKRVFNTKDEALAYKTPTNYLATVKIEWEE